MALGEEIQQNMTAIIFQTSIASYGTAIGIAGILDLGGPRSLDALDLSIAGVNTVKRRLLYRGIGRCPVASVAPYSMAD